MPSDEEVCCEKCGSELANGDNIWVKIKLKSDWIAPVLVDAFFPEFEDKCEGTFKNDLKTGDGVYYYANGVKFRGEWRECCPLYQRPPSMPMVDREWAKSINGRTVRSPNSNLKTSPTYNSQQS